jgi:hypothetical protein
MATRTSWPDASSLRRQTRALDSRLEGVVAYLRDNPPIPGPQGPPGPSAAATLRVNSSGAIALPSAPLVTVLLGTGASTTSIGSGLQDGQRVVIIATQGSGVTVQLAATDAIGTPLTEITLSHVAAGAQFVWDGVGERWLPIGVSYG